MCHDHFESSRASVANYSLFDVKHRRSAEAFPNHRLLGSRFALVVMAGGSLAVFGVLANALLARLFVSRLNFRHSPFFFLGFVALFDTLVDLVYILLLVGERVGKGNY